MSRIFTRAALALLMAPVAGASLRTQAPAVEREGHYVQADAGPIESAAQPANAPSISPVPAFQAPNRNPIAGAALRIPSTARGETDASAAHLVARAFNLPRSTKWESYR